MIPATNTSNPAESSHDRLLDRSFLWLCAAFAALKLAIQIIGNVLSQRAGYGIFRDELYYLMCGRHLALGYVDQPPMVALQARLTEMLFGFQHMWSLRLISALAGAAMVFLAGMLVRSLGGDRRAAALAMLGVIVGSIYLALDGYLSMNSFEPVFWIICMLSLIRIVQASSKGPQAQAELRNWWIVFGVSAGLGIENKDTIVFFLLAVLLALLLTGERRVLFNRWCAVSVAIIFALALPNFLWQVHYHFPTLEWLMDAKRKGKDVHLPPIGFLKAQILMLNPLTVLLWVSGLLWFLIARAARPYRFLGVLYLIFLPMMMALNAKDYYLAPIYVVYFAGGAVCWLHWMGDTAWRSVIVSVYALLLVLGFIITVPFSIPILPPHQFIAYEQRIGFKPKDSEVHAATALPQFYADRFGWHRMVQQIAAVYSALPPDERAVTGIYVQNYGEASAINLFGPKYGLPVAISGHQSYWLWGPHGYTGKEMILFNVDPISRLRREYGSCQIVGEINNRWAMPYEHGPIILCKDRIESYSVDWAHHKVYY